MSVRIRVTSVQIEGYNTCDTLVWADVGPLFCVTDVTNVTRNGDGPKMMVQWAVTRIVIFLGIATKSRAVWTVLRKGVSVESTARPPGRDRPSEGPSRATL